MKKDDLINLKVMPEEYGYSIYLDDKKIDHVENYEISQSALPGTAILKLELLVKYP
ncbi:hypothetical protein [Ruminococcus gauvreauii]|uniref:hypothetical protein n=1 Tax=Ruminococcus gauvreauii TaxID=438033 RepID=UPI00398418E5